MQLERQLIWDANKNSSPRESILYDFGKIALRRIKMKPAQNGISEPRD